MRTPQKSSRGFAQSAVVVRRQKYEIPISSVVAETMKLLANGLHGYQIMNCSRHTVTKYLFDKQTHAAIHIKLCKKLNHVSNASYEIEHSTTEIEHKEPISVVFFIPQHATLQMLEPYYNLSTKHCDVNKFEELQMDTTSLYLALAEKELEDCIRPEKKAEWERLRPRGCTNTFTADAVANFFPRKCCDMHKKLDNREPGLLIEEFRFTEILCSCRKNFCCNDVTTNEKKLSGKNLNKRVLEECDDESWEN